MTTYPDDDDGAVLRGIAADGVDMTRPLLIEFTATAPNQEVAFDIRDAVASHFRCAAEVVFEEGESEDDGHFTAEEIQAQRDDLGPTWLVCACLIMVPNYDEIVRIQAEMEQVARPLGGKSCGWGVTIEHNGGEPE